MSSLPSNVPKCDVLLNLFTSIGYSGAAGDRLAFKEFARIIRKHGLLIIDVRNSEPFKLRLLHPFLDEPEKGTIRIVRHEIKGKTWTLHNRLYKKRKNGDYALLGSRNTSVLLYTPKELSALCRTSGFKVLAIYSSYTFERLKDGDASMLLVAVKK